MPDPTPLPVHQARTFRAFVRAEYLDYEARAGARHRPLSWLPPLYLGTRAMLAMLRQGEQLGLSFRTRQRLIHAEFDAIHAERAEAAKR